MAKAIDIATAILEAMDAVNFIRSGNEALDFDIEFSESKDPKSAKLDIATEDGQNFTIVITPY